MTLVRGTWLWSGHSARVGAARDMARAGVSIPEIMQAGGWTNVNIVMNYIRNLDSETGGNGAPAGRWRLAINA